MRSLITLILFLFIFSYVKAQEIKVSAGEDLNLTCFDEFQLNGQIINFEKTNEWICRFKSIVFVNDTLGFASGSGSGLAFLVKTSDGGKTWNEIDVPLAVSMNDMHFLNKDTGFAVGGRDFEYQTVLKTVDGGNSWESKQYDDGIEPRSVYFCNDSVGYAVGWYGYATKTSDFGETWTKLEVPIGHYNDVYFLNDTIGIAVASNGVIAKTTNGGMYWDSIPSHTIFDLYAVILEEDFSYIVGGHGLILYSEDHFETHSFQNSGVLFDLYDIDFLNKDSLIAVGRFNTIISTSNAGKDWEKETSDYNYGDIMGVCYHSNKKKIAITRSAGYPYRGAILSYNESPRNITVSWDPPDYLSDPTSLTPIISPQSSMTYFLNISDTNGLLAQDTLNVNVSTPLTYAGNDITLEKGDSVRLHGITENGTWTLTHIGIQSWFNEVFFINSDTGFIAGSQYSGTIMRTVDGGDSWESMINDLSTNLYDVQFINDSVGIAVGYFGLILKSEDCGESWDTINSGTLEGLYSLDFIDEKTGFIAGESGIILKTEDGGDSWENVQVYLGLDLNKIYFVNENRGYATAIFPFECAFFQTDDGGKNWNQVNIPDMILNFNDIFFVNDKVGYMVGGNLTPFGFIKTTDGGESWDAHLFLRDSWIIYESVFFTDEYTGYVTNSDGEILKTVDGGNIWFIWDTVTGVGLNDLFFTDEYNAFGVGNSGVIARYHANENVKFNWWPNYNIINSDSPHPIVFPENSTTYYLEAFTEEGCYSVDDITIAISPSFNENIDYQDQTILVYPNPSADYLTIKFNSESPEIYYIKIYDGKGTIHYSNKIYSTNSGKFTYYHNLAPGIYFLEIESEQISRTEKIIIKQ